MRSVAFVEEPRLFCPHILAEIIQFLQAAVASKTVGSQRPLRRLCDYDFS